MLPLNTIERAMRQVCKDYMKGEDKMKTDKDLLDERKFWQDTLATAENEMAKEELHKDVMKWKSEVRMCKKHLRLIKEELRKS